MSPQNIVEETLISTAQLADLPDIAGPCVSIYLSAYSSQNDSVPFGAHVHEALERAKQELDAKSLAATERELLLRQLHDVAQTWGPGRRAGSLAVFYAQGFIRALRTAYQIRESVHIADAFYIRPLLPALMHKRDFCILALSQKHVRLLRCTDGEMKALVLPAPVPTSVAQAGAFDAPDHDLEARASAGSSSGAMSRIQFGTNTAEEKVDAYIHDFFKILDREINHLFGQAHLPIVLAAVDREIALYRKASSYPYLLQEAISGSPDHVTDSELHHQALDALNIQRAADEDQLLFDFSEQDSRGFALTEQSSILAAARRGQIHRLLLSEHDSATAADETLNLIALETIRHHGQVSTLSHSQLPGKRPVVATLRYRGGEAGESKQ